MEARTPLVSGFQHVAVVTNDLDRLAAFYEEVFGARVALVLGGHPGSTHTRHALIEIAEGVVLHPFEVPGADLDAGGTEILQRGRIDHFAIMTPTEDGFSELRRRLMDRGASDGVVTDFGPIVSVGFDDPDGARLEVVWVKEDVPLSEAREPQGFEPPKSVAARGR